MDQFVDALQQRWTDRAVLCTHGEVLRALFERLGARSLLADPVEPPWHKGPTWVLERVGPALQSRYLPPPTSS